jgi:hypothetical protein
MDEEKRAPFGQRGWQTWALATVLVVGVLLLVAVYQAQ